MSTRYVWEKYTINSYWETILLTLMKGSLVPILKNNTSSYITGTYFYINVFNDVTVTTSGSGVICSSFSKSTKVNVGETFSLSGPYGKYVVLSDVDLSDVGQIEVPYAIQPEARSATFTLVSDSSGRLSGENDELSPDVRIAGKVLPVRRIEKGSLIGYASNSSSIAFPNDNYSGDYWYTYKGSDNIDPTAIGYNKTSPKGGESITINVTPRSNTYGGTIRYQYEVQLSGGAWTSIGTSTATSKSYTIPKGTTSFRARVLAKDNMGFTPSTYVTGSTLTVINNTAPTISGSNSNLGSFTYLPPYIEYVINDVDGNTVSVSIQLDSQSIYSGTAVLGKTEFIVFPDWDSLLNGSHTITITANDGQGGVTTRTYTFSKSVNANLISRERWRRLNEGNVYDIIYFETAADIVTTNNGKYLRDRINAIRSRVAALKGTSATALAAMDSSIITERLHMKTDSGYNVKYLDTKSQYVKIGSQTVEEVLAQIESDIAALKG